MDKVKPIALARFRAALGSKGYEDDPEVISPWLEDWRGLYSGASVAILSPETTQEVAAIVTIAREEGVALVPQGGNTSMVGGATPAADGSAVILSLRRMNRILSIDPAAGFAVVEAGVILQTLHEAAAAKGCRFPLSLAAKGSATLGGLVSTCAGGTQVLRFGTMRTLTLGVKAVLPDGSIHDGLSPLKKDTRGYDLNQLLIGAEGTLGVVTTVAVRLVPAIGDRAVGWIGVSSPQAALTLLRMLEGASGSAIESFELVPDHSLQHVLAYLPDARAPLASSQPWHVLVEAVAERDAASKLESWLAAAAEAGLLEDATLATSEAQAEAFWQLRESVSAAERAQGPAMQHDISVPVDIMPRFMIEAAAAVEASFAGVSASGFGHLGDGNIHFHVRAPKGVDGAAWRAGEGKAASALVYQLVTQAGGSISAEHGIGQMKLDALARHGGAARNGTLRAIKTALDPTGMMNPGKLVPPCL